MTKSLQEISAVFGQQLKRARERRGWSIRDLCDKSGVSINTISRSERGYDVMLSNAVAMAAALGMPLSVLLDESACPGCNGTPPGGFICSACGREGTA